MAQQWVEIAEQAVRGVIVGDEVWYPLPVVGSLKPAFNPTDEPRKEFRGADTGQGDSSVRRKESAWAHPLEFVSRPCAARALLLKHLFGNVAARTVVETTGYKGLLLMENLPFGVGATLGTTAVMIRTNYDNGQGTTVSKIYHGGRITKGGVKGSGTDDVMMTIDLGGPGEYITAETAGTAVPNFDTLPAPFNSSDTLLYIGAGATRTGTPPDYTALAPNTMLQFIPDSFEITIETGRADKVVMDGVRGPNKTYKEGQLAITASFPIDITDPSSGFSSHDEIENLFTGPREFPVMLVMDNGVLAGDTAATFKDTWDLPRQLLKPVKEEFNTEGKTPSCTLECSHLYSLTTLYSIALLTQDQLDEY
jgi:hypothetical protein